MKLQAAARAIRGSKDVQEDAFRVHDAKGQDAGEIAASDAGVALSGGGLVLVADGIGGHYGGDIASAVTADAFVKTFFGGGSGAEARLKASLEAANQAVAAAQEKEPGLKDMGSTLVAGFIEGDTMSFVSIGDSLILRYRDGELHRVNADHSYMEIADREALGSGDPGLWRDVMTRKGRDSITIAVLGRSLNDFGHSPQIESRKVLPGDLLVFSSDGLETLSMVQIQNFIRALLPNGVGAVADGLIKAVDGIGKNRNYQDNATLVVVQADGVQTPRTAAVPEKDIARTSAATEVASAPAASAPAASARAGGISESARTGRWAPAKILLGVLLSIAGLVAILFATGKGDMFRSSIVRVAPSPVEQGLQQRSQPAAETESQPQPRAPKNTQTPGG